MDKVTSMAKTSAKSGFTLFIGVSISSVITAVGLILVLRLLGDPDEYGIVTTALIVPTTLSLLKDWGINSAMIKYLAQYRTENKTENTRNVMVAGLVFELVTGALLTLLCFVLAEFLATDVFKIPEAKVLIQIASFTVIGDSFLKISQSTFIGFERLEFHSLTLILNASIRCFLAPLLVTQLNFPVLGAIQGQIAAQLVAGIVGLLIFHSVFFSKSSKNVVNKLNLTKTLKTLLKYGLPLSVSAVIAGLLPQFFNILLTQSVPAAANITSTTAATNATYTTPLGNYQAAVNFTVIITFFTVPITTVLFPAFSKIKVGEEKESLRVVFQSSVKYGTLLALPVTLMIMVLSEPLVFAIIGTEYTDAPLFLVLYSTLFFQVVLGSLSLEGLLNGQNKTEITMRLALITLACGLLLGLTLITQFGVIGLIVTNSIAGLPSLFVGLWWVKKHFGATVDWVSSAKIFLASVVAAVVTHLILSSVNFGQWIELFIGGIVFLLIYFVVAPLIRAVNENDVRSLREMLSSLGPLSYVFNIPLKIIEKLLKVLKF